MATTYAAWSQASTDPDKLSVVQWREDLAVFREQVPKLHGNAFHAISRGQFDAAIDQLESALPRLSSDQVKSEILRLVAMVNDGHTRVRLPSLQDHMLPVRLYFFADGLYVEAADQKYAEIVGGKVKRIGALSAEDAYTAVRPLISVDKDNEYRRRLLAPDLMVTMEILRAIGAVSKADLIGLTVMKNGREINLDLPSGPFRAWNNHGWPADPQGWVNARRAARNPVPVWLQHTDRNYWHEYVGTGKTLYVQYNNVEDDPQGETIARYFPLLFRKAEAKGVSRLILDLRLNGGGNNALNRPIWHALIKSDHLNERGRLWVLIGPKTFSAAISCVGDLESNTNAIFVGEPTGEPPNQWGDPVDLTLPNSGITVQVSTLWWQFADPRDDRPFRAPDIPAPFSFADYAGNVDPAMEAVEVTSQQLAKENHGRDQNRSWAVRVRR